MSRDLHVETAAGLRGGWRVEWVDRDEMLLSRGNRLFSGRDLNPPYGLIGSFPCSIQARAAGRFHLARRLLRFFFSNVIRLPDGRILATFQKQIGLFEGTRFTAVQGLLRPCRFLRGGCAVDAEGGVLLGEYLDNPDRSPIRIYRLLPGATKLEVVQEFAAGSVRHIHGIYRDPFEPFLWITCGDRPQECRLMRTDDCFETLETVGQGDETWRAVSLQFRRRCIYYAADAEFRQNHLYRIDRETLNRRVLSPIDGPVYYSTSGASHLFFAVTAEGAASQKRNRASIWSIDVHDQAHRVVAFDKDRYPNAALGSGILDFPLGPGRSGEVFFNGIGLKNADNRIFALRGSSHPSAI